LKRNAGSWLQARNERLASPDENQNWSFTGLLHRHRAAVIHFLYRMLQDGTVAEDLAVEVFLRFYRSGARTGPVGLSAITLFRIATDLALREPRNPMSAPAPEQLPDVLDVGRVVACMPAKQRAAVLMHKYHQMDCWQIAKVLNCSESVARSLLLSAYENLRRLAPAAAPRNEELASSAMPYTLFGERL
jgi:RNA polymerase sigma-70 factor (ECF subfamily)